MGLSKHKLDQIEEQECSQLGKTCERCGTPISYSDYAENDGYCLYCKEGAEKALEEDEKGRSKND